MNIFITSVSVFVGDSENYLTLVVGDSENYFTLVVMILHDSEKAPDEKQFVCSKNSVYFWFVLHFDKEIRMFA